ncbi:MAG: hypothetical protein ACRDHP_13190 [Ktedonobacterales bacterium]
MSNDRTHEAGTPETPSDASSERKLGLFAVEELFIEELRSGGTPRLSDYLRCYPALAEELTAFASVVLPEAALDAGNADAADATMGSVRSVAAPELSPGTRRALRTIRAEVGNRQEPDETLLVAEKRAAYATHAPGIESLARSRDVSLDALAELIDSSPEKLAPEVLWRIANTLGVSVDEAKRALDDAF